MGFYTRAGSENCLIAIKGKFKVLKKNVRSVFLAENLKHSQKPACVRNKIMDLCGDLPRIELFAREKIDGWDSWGNEIKSDIDLMDVKKVKKLKKKEKKISDEGSIWYDKFKCPECGSRLRTDFNTVYCSYILCKYYSKRR